MSTPRLQKYLALCGVCSRREAERRIAAGRVRVNGEVVTDPARAVQVGEDKVEADGVEIRPAAHRYVLLNKPSGTVCTRRDEKGRDTIYSLVPADMAPLSYVGRLDLTTRGVLLLTNDGDLNYRLTRPEFGVVKEYEAKVRGRVTPRKLDRLVAGVEHDGQKLQAQSARLVKRFTSNALLHLSLTEGKTREVRRMLEAVDLHVVWLERTRFAGLTADGLEPGEWRELTPREVGRLQKVTGLTPGE